MSVYRETSLILHFNFVIRILNVSLMQIIPFQELDTLVSRNKEKHKMQLDEDFCTAICILLGKFAVLLGNNKFQTIIQPYEKSLKPRK